MVCALSIAPALAGKIYKWVDERGVVHFSDHPPHLPESLQTTVEERDLTGQDQIEKKDEIETKPMARSPIEHVANCTFTIKGMNKVGTGFLISSTGYGATCRHVIEEGGGLIALLSDQKEYPITVISSSSKYDLALIQLMIPQKTPFLSLREADDLVPGERLFAVGASAGLQATVTDGVFTAFRRMDDSQSILIQFSAPVNPGQQRRPTGGCKRQGRGRRKPKIPGSKGGPHQRGRLCSAFSLPERRIRELSGLTFAGASKFDGSVKKSARSSLPRSLSPKVVVGERESRSP
jgi:hypothetical protein